MSTNDKGLEALRAILKRMRNDEQNSYHDVKNGKFSGFISRGFGQATPDELNAIFELAGIVPDGIQVNGTCKDCVFGNAGGGDLGWAQPCCSCSRPKMTNFVPLSSLMERSFVITDHQAHFLENVKNGVWWATGIVTADQFSKKWNAQIQACHRTEDAMKKRDMMGESMGVRHLTRKGLKALQNHRQGKRAA